MCLFRNTGIFKQIQLKAPFFKNIHIFHKRHLLISSEAPVRKKQQISRLATVNIYGTNLWILLMENFWNSSVDSILPNMYISEQKRKLYPWLVVESSLSFIICSTLKERALNEGNKLFLITNWEWLKCIIKIYNSKVS